MNRYKGLELRLFKNTLFKVVIILFAFLITLPLFAIIFYVLKTGLSKISWHFLVNTPKPVGELGGGIANALLGSIMIVLVATVIAVPIGILCGIYLSENPKNRIAYYSRRSHCHKCLNSEKDLAVEKPSLFLIEQE